MSLVFSGPAWSASEEATKSQVPERSVTRVSQIPVLPGTLEHLGKPGVVKGGAPGFVDEVEPNDTPATAQSLPGTPVRVRGSLYRAPFVAGNTDVDVFSFTAGAGDRVYAATMTALSGGSTDTLLDIIDVDGTTVLETDDEDGAIGGSASNIAGTVLATGGTYFVRVRPFSVAFNGTIRPYDLYVRVLSGSPTPEIEPNDNGGTPNPLPPNGWVSGVIGTAGDTDTFSLAASAGDTIVAILDVDPERDAPEWNARLGIGLFNNFFLVVNGSSVGGTFDDANPSEAFFMTVKTSGTYVIYVDEPTTGGAANFTYHLSVSVIPGRARTCTSYAGTTGPITDFGTTDFTVAVPDLRTIDYLKVSLAATQTATADLDVSLISPDGNEVFLFDDPPNTVSPAPQINLILEDEAAIAIGQFFIDSGMHYAPELAGRLEYFKGMQAQGAWTLRVRDDTAGNTGTVNSWSLEVCEPAPRPACLVPGPLETTVFSSDFESGDGGFTHSGTADEWERGLPTFAPITSAHSGTNAWKTDLDNTYDLNANNNLVSPTLDLTTTTGRITLNWWQKFQMESASFDTYWVEVRQVGVPANSRRLFSWTGATMTRAVGNPLVTIQQSAGWGLVQADISDFAGMNAEVVFHVESDNTLVFAGVAIDDVVVTSCAVVAGASVSNVGITKTDNQGTYFPGEQLTYSIVAGNAGPDPVDAANVVDTFPTDLTAVSWSCVASAGSACGSGSGTGDIDATVDLLVNGTATFTVTTTVSLAATGDIANTATIAVPLGWDDPDPADNTATDTDVLVAAAPQALAVDPTGDGVLEPGETAAVAPSWRNTGAAPIALTGTLTNHAGPAGGTYTIPDGAADYGAIAVAGTASCTTSANCYTVSPSATTRPVQHWDSTVLETVAPTGVTKTWTLHIGNSFTDVPASSPFYRFIETLLHKGVTGGCGGTNYCPSTATTREQMAVFVLLSKEGVGYTPAACAPPNTFTDVPETSPFCRYIEELAARGVVGGCGGNNYCPTGPVTREQMAIFVLRTLDPALNPTACAPPNMFADVPETSPFCRWIEELATRGVVTGCGNGNYCPSASVTREQMGVFLSATFGLTLYGL
jgi:uncharacterized repeat protein (TIGR01451 family)